MPESSASHAWVTSVLRRVTQFILDRMQTEGWYHEGQLTYEPPTVWDINCGCCEEWAVEAADVIGEDAVAVWLEELDPLVYGLSPEDMENFEDASHMVLFYKGRFYDSQTLEGVEDPRELPLMCGVPRSNYLPGVV